MKRYFKVRGSLVGVFVYGASIGMALAWYDWKLALIILVAITGNNLERSSHESNKS